MPKTQTAEDKRAAFKAKDEADRLERIALDAETLEAILTETENAHAACVRLEALCGVLVSDMSHYALKAQASGGPSGSLNNIRILAEQSLEGIKTLPAADAG